MDQFRPRQDFMLRSSPLLRRRRHPPRADTPGADTHRITTHIRPANAPPCVVVRILVVMPRPSPGTSLIPRIRLIYGQNKEPTSGLEPLTYPLYECAVNGC
jgi:hypothetical protein